MEGVNIANSKIQEAASNKSYSLYQAKEASSGVGVSKAQLDQAKNYVQISEKDLDKANINVSLSQGQSDAQIKEAEAKVEASKAYLAQAQAAYDYQQKEFERKNNLYKEEVISKSEYDSAEAYYKNALEQLNAAQKQLNQAESSLDLAKTTAYNIALNKKQLESAYASLDNAKYGEHSAEVTVISSQAKEASAYSMVDVYSARYDTAIASLGQAQAQAKTAQLQIQVAQSNLKEAELSYKAALSEEKGVEANLLAYEAALLSAKADLDDTNIYAPSDGVILTKVAELGEVLSPGGVLFTMVDLNKLYMKAYLPEELFGKIKIGSEARIYLDAYKDKYFEATVKEMNQQAEFTPKNIEVKDQRVKLVFGLKAYIKDNSAGEAKPGMPGDTRVKYEDNARW